jgi:hypothetical protein
VLSEHQARLIAELLSRDAAATDPDAAVAGDAIVELAELGLASVCPIATSLLSFDQRLSSEVRNELQRREGPVSLHEWGVQFATRLASDPDPWISWAAQVDAGTLAAAESQRLVDPSCPGNPMHAILLIRSGTDPRAN